VVQVALLTSVWIFVACVALSKYLSNTALKHLNIEQKGRITDGLSTLNAYETIPLAMLLYVFVLYTHSTFEIRNANTLFGSILLSYMVILAIITYRIIKKLSLPPTYVKRKNMSLLVHYSGCIQLIVVYMLIYRN